jgi:hypothetical protein
VALLVAWLAEELIVGIYFAVQLIVEFAAWLETSLAVTLFAGALFVGTVTAEAFVVGTFAVVA